MAKFFFLAMAVIQWLVATVILIRFQFDSKNFFVATLFIVLGAIFFSIFLILQAKIKRVAVGKNKIVVIEGDRNLRFEWPEVKSLSLVPVFNVYKLKLKGKREPIYFFPSKNVIAAFGLIEKDTSRMGEIVEKRKREFNIK
ncbi:MAG TPA: hypothetical protein VGD65_07280 [Chryseosolibacter sp.]